MELLISNNIPGPPDTKTYGTENRGTESGCRMGTAHPSQQHLPENVPFFQGYRKKTGSSPSAGRFPKKTEPVHFATG
jgi:hypothetical protein